VTAKSLQCGRNKQSRLRTNVSTIFLQNDTDFIKIYPLVTEIWHVEIRWYPPFSAKIRDFKGQFSENTGQISMQFTHFCAQPACIPNLLQQISDGSVKK